MLKIKRIFLEGVNKNYIVSFKNGLNIIYGDSDKGKTTILELIKYGLGGSKFKVNIEMKEKVKRFFLEVEIYGELLSIERDILNKENFIKVYNFKAEEILRNKNIKFEYYCTEKNNDFNNFSDFLLKKMRIPLGRIYKKSRGKDEIEFQTVTLPSILNYCYLTQDEIGNKNMLHLENPALYGVNTKILKYIYRVLDDEIAKIEKEKSDLVSIKNSLGKEHDIIRDFLTDGEIKEKSEIEKEINDLQEILNILNDKKDLINNEILEKTSYLEEFRKNLNKNYVEEKENTIEVTELKNQSKKFKNLLEQYEKEMKKIEIAIMLLKNTDSNLDIDCSCPVCNNKITIEDVKDKYEIGEEEYLKNEKNKLKSKYSSLKKYLDEINKRTEQLIKENINLKEEILKLEEVINLKTGIEISPYISLRDSLNEKLGGIKEKVNVYTKLINLRNKEDERKIKILNLSNKINDIEEILKSKISENVSVDDIRTSLSLNFEKILRNIEIENIYGVSINKRFVPVFRNIDYGNHSSGGVRTILSVSYFLSILEDTNLKKLNKPPLLLIDTIGNFLGKNKEKDDNDEIVNDPKKCKNMYREIIRISKEAELRGESLQVIVVDNDYPGKEYEGYMRKKFGKEKNYECGLINDYE